LGSLDLAADKLETGDAQGLNYAASAAKSFEAMFRKARGLDEGPSASGGASVNLFFLGSPEPVQEKRAEPVEVAAADPEGF